MFLRAGEFIRNQEVLSIRLATHEAPRVDLRTKSSPTCNGVAAILLDDNVGAERDIILYQLQRISYTHPACDPLHFRWLFPHGGLDWNLAFRYQSGATSHHSNTVWCSEFTAYILHQDPWVLIAASFVREVSMLTTEKRVPSLPGSPGTSRLFP